MRRRVCARRTSSVYCGQCRRENPLEGAKNAKQKHYGDLRRPVASVSFTGNPQVILLGRLLFGAVVLVCSICPPAMAAKGHGATISAAPGTLVRWAVPGAKRCSMKGH